MSCYRIRVQVARFRTRADDFEFIAAQRRRKSLPSGAAGIFSAKNKTLVLIAMVLLFAALCDLGWFDRLLRVQHSA